MARISLFLFALFASVLLALASPVPASNGEILDIQKRLTHTGRVSYFFFFKIYHASGLMLILRTPGNLVPPWSVFFCVVLHLIIDRSLLTRQG